MAAKTERSEPTEHPDRIQQGVGLFSVWLLMGAPPKENYLA